MGRPPKTADPTRWMDKVGGKSTPEYQAWQNMKARCTKANHPLWKWYGARGIKVCDRWLASFDYFLADMGRRPDGHTLDRINNDGNYEPGNCRWATPKDQSSNTRTNRLFTIDGVTKSLTQWARHFGINAATLRDRVVVCGMDIEEAAKVPVIMGAHKHFEGTSKKRKRDCNKSRSEQC